MSLECLNCMFKTEIKTFIFYRKENGINCETDFDLKPIFRIGLSRTWMWRVLATPR